MFKINVLHLQSNKEIKTAKAKGSELGNKDSIL